MKQADGGATHIITVDLYDSLRIGDDITVTIADINRAQVKLGIEAPREVVVLREELTLTMDRHDI